MAKAIMTLGEIIDALKRKRPSLTSSTTAGASLLKLRTSTRSKRMREWLIRLLGGTTVKCNHKWTVPLEHYPTFTQDYWQCKRCKFTKAFQNDKPPEPIKTEMCNMAHFHIINGR